MSCNSNRTHLYERRDAVSQMLYHKDKYHSIPYPPLWLKKPGMSLIRIETQSRFI